ncbi:MAG: tRNA (adenosine(37)-N6)-dimethylallyltransferase MiaA [Bacteroidota bacterium]|nr:tRNA (adenosine(37)-N6)-dimethylallyltransferase MiaA [Bacteroidota bacterium]
MASKKTCIIVSGATATGKTDYALELAHRHNTQIISADSRQCYTELNIGVAKPTAAQLSDVHHYFINSHSITDEVNVKVFERYALGAVYKIFKTNDVAIMAGGTGLYIKAFCEGIDEIPAIDEILRSKISESYKTGGIDWLIDEIKKNDPIYFASGEIQNPQRMMRALEVKLSNGKSILDFHSGKNIQRDFEIKKINLEVPREELYERINNRVNSMVDAGLLNEVENLFPYRHLNALQTVGYRELFEYVEGKISLSQAVDDIKKNTRHFAKRQITWFKKYNS